MKKAVLILVMLLVSLVTIGQTTIETKVLYESKTGFKITERTEGETKQVYFSFVFKNEKYKYLSDYGSIIFLTSEEANHFAEKLIEFSKLEKGKEVNYIHKDFILVKYSSFATIFVMTNDAKKYTTFSSQQLVKLANEILENSHLIDQ